MSAAAAANDARSILATFGVDCTYLPKSGEARAITGSPGPVENAPIDGERKVQDSLTFWLLVLRDPDNAIYGGISDPQRGESLKIDGETESEKFGITGAIRNRDAYSWEIELEQKRTFETGGNRIR